MNDPFVFFQGFEHMVTGIVVPFLVAVGACLVRVAFWGWQGMKAFVANFTIAFVLGMAAHWIMLDMDIGGATRTAITLGVALVSKDILDTVFSRRAMCAVRERLIFEIRHRFRWRGPECSGNLPGQPGGAPPVFRERPDLMGQPDSIGQPVCAPRPDLDWPSRNGQRENP